MASRKLEVEIVGDASSLKKAFGQAGSATDGFGSSLAKLGKLAAVGLAAVGAGAIAAGVKMVTMAGNAAEVDSKMQVVFGKELPGLKKNLDVFADATGASSFKLREQAADLGALLGPLVGTKAGAADMSSQFVKLATDLGSFNNVPVDEALLAIRSGLVGEAEPLRRFGVLLNAAAVEAEGLRLGLVKGNEELTEQQKVQARASLIMQQTTQAQGDATRTADSYANQIKALKNTVTDLATGLGTKLLPAATAVAGGLNDFINKIGAADGAGAKFGVAMDAFKTIAGKAWDGIKATFNAIDWNAVGQTLADGLRRAIQFLAGIDYGGILRTVADKVLTTLKAVFNAIDWGAVGSTIGNLLIKVLNTIASFVNRVDWNAVGQALVTGLGKAIAAIATFLAGVNWPSVLKAIGLGIIAVLKGLAGLLLGIATALGAAIVTGIGNGLAGIAAKVQEKIGAARQAIVDATGTAYANALGVGKAIVQGFIDGIASMAQAVADKAVAVARGAWEAAKNFLDIRSPSGLFAGIGADTIRGFILGITAQQPALEGKMKEAVSKALDAAKATVERYQGAFGDVFSKLADFAARAFDAKTQSLLDALDRKFDAKIAKWQAFGAALTPAEKAIAALDAAEQQRSRDSAKASAEEQLAKAQAMAEGAERDAAILAAMEAMRQAELSITRAKLEATAAVERAAQEASAAAHIAALEATKAREAQNLEERRTQLGERLDAQLATLQARLAKHPEEYDKIQKQIQKLLASYGIPMHKAGENLGKAFARGIRDSIDDAVAAAKALAKAVAQYLPHSPAEKGPLSKPIDWKGYLTEGLPSGRALAGMASGLVGGMAGGSGMAMAGGGGGGGITIVNNYNGPIFGDDKQRIADEMADANFRALKRRFGDRIINHGASVLS